MDLPPAKVTEVLRHGFEPLSFSQRYGEDGDAELADLIEDRCAVSPFDAAVTSLLVDDVAIMLNALDERDREIITLRYGLDRDGPRTLKQIGERLNLTREGIRQLETQAMFQLRHNCDASREDEGLGQ